MLLNAAVPSAKIAGGAVDPGQGAEVHDEDVGADLRIGADGGRHLHPQTEEVALLVERQLRFGDRDRLRVAEERLGVGCSST